MNRDKKGPIGRATLADSTSGERANGKRMTGNLPAGSGPVATNRKEQKRLVLIWSRYRVLVIATADVE